MTHSIIRRKILDKVGNFNSEMDGAQDWDLFFRISEVTDRVYHINKILYHWRSIDTSAASGSHIKSYALDAQKNAVENHLKRIGLRNPKYQIQNHVRKATWEYQKNLVSIVIPMTNFILSTSEIIKFHQLIGYSNSEIILVDNKIKNGFNNTNLPNSIKHYTLEGSTTIEAINHGAMISKGKYLFIAHPKMLPSNKNSLEELVMWIQKPGVGLVCSKLVNKHSSKIHSFGRVIGLAGLVGDLFKGLDPESTTFFGSTMNYYNFQTMSPYGILINREKFLSLGGYSDDFHEDFAAINISLKLLEDNLRICANPFSIFFISPNMLDIDVEDIINAYSLLKENRLVMNDYYNKNLSYLHEAPTLSNNIGKENSKEINSVIRRYYRRNGN